MKLLAFLKSIHDSLLTFTQAITFDKTNQVHFSRIALYASLIEFSGAIINLIENKCRIAVPSVFRTFLETAVELRNLNNDPAYVEYMYSSHAKEWLRVLREAQAGNPYLAKIDTDSGLGQAIAKYEKELEMLENKGVTTLNTFQRFERAGMVEEYRSLYNFLSCDAHSNIRALIDRHFRGGSADFEIVYYKDEPIESFVATLDSTAELLLQASLETHIAFKSAHVEDVKAMLAKFEEIRM